MLSTPFRQEDATQAPRSVNEAWQSSLDKVLADQKIPEEIRAEMQTQKGHYGLVETRNQVNVAFANYEKSGFGHTMKKAQPIVDGLLKVGELGAQLANGDPHGIAGLV